MKINPTIALHPRFIALGDELYRSFAALEALSNDKDSYYSENHAIRWEAGPSYSKLRGRAIISLEKLSQTIYLYADDLVELDVSWTDSEFAVRSNHPSQEFNPEFEFRVGSRDDSTGHITKIYIASPRERPAPEKESKIHEVILRDSSPFRKGFYTELGEQCAKIAFLAIAAAVVTATVIFTTLALVGVIKQLFSNL